MPVLLSKQKTISGLLAMSLIGGYCTIALNERVEAADATPGAAAAGGGTGTVDVKSLGQGDAAAADKSANKTTNKTTNKTADKVTDKSADKAVGTAADKTAATDALKNDGTDKKADASADDAGPAPKMIWKPGESLTTETGTEDIVATYDVNLAQRQLAAYPDSPEASFILAVALTRTSRVEDALKEVQHARKLAASKGGPAYFDKMIASYEQMLVNYPDDNQVRYGLAWAYYMKAYLLAQEARKAAQSDPVAMQKRWLAANPGWVAQHPEFFVAHPEYKSFASGGTAGGGAAGAAGTTSGAVNDKDVVKALTGGNPANALSALATAAGSIAGNQKLPADSLPHIPTAMEKAGPNERPQIKRYYEQAMQKLDEILLREPDDVWTIVYRAHLKAEYTGDLGEAMATWTKAASKFPNNPAPHFFLGEGYLKEGNLKESINHVSQAISLRALHPLGY